MKDYSLIVLPFQLIATFYILRHFRPRLATPTFLMVIGSLTFDLAAVVYAPLFPLPSFLIIGTVLRYYGSSWVSVGYAAVANALMYVVYSRVPMGEFFVTAVNYYVAYTAMQCLTTNEFFIKNALYYAALKHLSIAADKWFNIPSVFEFIADGLSVIVAYYLVRASYYYYAKGKEPVNASQKIKSA